MRGLSEGGYLGSLLYPFLPDDLAQRLEILGVGPGVEITAEQSAYLCDPTVPDIAERLEKMDRTTSWRTPLLLHADYHAIPTNKARQAQSALNICNRWSLDDELEYHYLQMVAHLQSNFV